MSTRVTILMNAAKLTDADRNQSYGEPVGNMQNIASLLEPYINMCIKRGEGQLRLRGEDVAHMMSLMKIARTMAPPHTEDNYVDGACYQAIAGECSEAERMAGSDPA